MAKQITVTIPDAVDERMRAIAAKEGRTLSNLVAFALEVFLRTYKPL